MPSALQNKLEKVLQGLRCCQNQDALGCRACPYNQNSADCLSACIADAEEVITKLRGMIS